MWGVDCSQWVNQPAEDPRVPWAEYTRDEEGNCTLTGNFKISDVSPEEDPLLLGDYGDCHEWLRDHDKHLDEAIARRHQTP